MDYVYENVDKEKALDLYKMLLENFDVDSLPVDYVWSAYSRYVSARPELEALPKRFAGLRKNTLMIDARTNQRRALLRNAAKKEGDTLSTSDLLSCLRHLPSPFSLSELLSLKELHRLALVDKGWYRWIIQSELPKVWRRMLPDQSEFEWKQFERDDVHEREDWRNINIWIGPPINQSESQNRGPYPLLFDRAVSWITKPDWFESMEHFDWLQETSNAASLVDDPSLGPSKNKEIPDWVVPFFLSLSSASCWIGKREIPKNNVMEGSHQRFYYFIVPNEQEGMPPFEVLFYHYVGGKSWYLY